MTEEVVIINNRSFLIWYESLEQRVSALKEAENIINIHNNRTTSNYPLSLQPPGVSLTLDKTSVTQGELVTVNACAPNGTLRYINPSGATVGSVLIPPNGCKTDSIAPSTIGTYTARITDNVTNATLIQKQIYVSAGTPTPQPPTTQPPTQPPTTQPPITQPPVQCNPDTEIFLPSIGCVPKNYLVYGGVGIALLVLLR